MPGKVSQAHVKQESNCANCHDRSNARHAIGSVPGLPQGDRRRCKATHRGYHGRMANAGAGECRACHTEHKGRDADIVQLDRLQFDHGLTDFKLDGAHASLDCAACHKPGEPWRKAAADLRRLPQGRRCAPRSVHAGLLRLPWLHQLDRRPIRSRQDALSSSPAPTPAWLRCLPYRRPSTSRRRRPASAVMRPTTSIAAHAARTARSATPPRSGRPRNTIILRRPASSCWACTPRSTASPATAAATTRKKSRRIATAVTVPTMRMPRASAPKCADCHDNDAGNRSSLRSRGPRPFRACWARTPSSTATPATPRRGHGQKLGKDCVGLPSQPRIRTAASSRAAARLPRPEHLAERHRRSITI